MMRRMINKMKHAADRIFTKNRAAVGILLIVSSICFAACGRRVQDKNNGMADTPEEMAECVMESIKYLDLDTFNEKTDNYIQTYTNILGMPTSAEYRVFNELLQPGRQKGKHYERSHKLTEKIVEQMTWEIKEVREKDGKAEIDMEITNIDMGSVMGRYEISILEDVLKSEGTGFWQFTKDMADLTQDAEGLINIMDSLNEDDICTIDVTVLAYKEDGQWKLHVSDEFINAFMGNIDAEEYAEDMEEKIAELEKRYDEKLDDWAEDFRDNFY